MPELAALRARLQELAPVVVAFSGGADSAFLAWVANDALGPARALAVTAVSPSLAAAEREDCERLAAEWGLRWRAVETDELARPEYVANDGDRCYHCKRELYRELADLVARVAAEAVLDGTIADDTADWRPGRRAAAELEVRSPLSEVGVMVAAACSRRRRAISLRT